MSSSSLSCLVERLPFSSRYAMKLFHYYNDDPETGFSLLLMEYWFQMLNKQQQTYRLAIRNVSKRKFEVQLNWFVFFIGIDCRWWNRKRLPIGWRRRSTRLG